MLPYMVQKAALSRSETPLEATSFSTQPASSRGRSRAARAFRRVAIQHGHVWAPVKTQFSSIVPSFGPKVIRLSPAVRRQNIIKVGPMAQPDALVLSEKLGLLPDTDAVVDLIQVLDLVECKGLWFW